MNPIILAFFTGLTTGGISCLAVQGGLLASAITQKSTSDKTITITSIFLGSKLIAYTILGFLLGALGSAITLTPTVQGWMQIFAGLYMLATAANLLNLHPIFRRVVIQPPTSFYKLAKSQAKAKSVFAPAMLGFLTVLIPCGITQAMFVYAIASANPFVGAGIMAAFTLGTTPVFAAIGTVSAQLLKKKAFVYIASTVILILGIASLNAGQNLRGSAHTLENYWTALITPPGQGTQIATNANISEEGKQEITIEVNTSGYKSSANTLKAGVPVRLKLVTNNTVGCSRAFTIPAFGLSRILPETGEDYIEFTPTKTGRLAYTCSMGMYSGSFTVI